MKLKTMILSATVAGAMAFGVTTSAQAFTTNYPVVAIQISGTINYSPNYDTELSQEVPLKKVSYTTKSLIQLLNASSYASNHIFSVTGRTSIPSGSSFLFSPYDGELYLTNKDGFFFPLEGSGYDLGYLEVDTYQLIGTYKLNSSNYSGTEMDMTGIYFYFYDGANYENEIETYGTGALNWTYGPNNGLFHKTTLSVKMSSKGGYYGYVYAYEANPGTFTASGTGSEANQLISTNIVPFYYNY